MDTKGRGRLAVVLMMGIQHKKNIFFFHVLQSVPPTNPCIVLNRRRPDRFRQVLGGDDRIRGQGYGSLDHMLELAYVAGP